jgi:hypothetical protein
MMLDELSCRRAKKCASHSSGRAAGRPIIAGIKMHVQGMTVEEATRLFETAGHQPHPVALSEAKRSTADALYGCYTMGKLI